MDTGKGLSLKTAKRLMLSFVLLASLLRAQEGALATRAVAAVVSVDTKGITADAATVIYMLNLELEKTQLFQLMDKYDVQEAVRNSKLDPYNCFSKSCLLSAGAALKTDKVITGSIERFGEKIVITLRMFDVKSAVLEKSNATEYINLQNEIQSMVAVSVKKLLGLTPDQRLIELLVNYQRPISSPKTSQRLNGPRMGASITLGETGKRLEDPLNVGGFDMMPVASQFGWQQEWQYMSSGNFQALIESVFLVGGMENGKVIPSITLLNGFRNSRNGWEFALGPTFRIVKKADGFYDTEGMLGNKGDWRRQSEWEASGPKDTINGNAVPQKNPYNIVSRLDSRGDTHVSTGLIIAIGKTFRSGYLNIPVNVYCSPRKDGWVFGASFGFNIAKRNAGD